MSNREFREALNRSHHIRKGGGVYGNPLFPQIEYEWAWLFVKCWNVKRQLTKAVYEDWKSDGSQRQLVSVFCGIVDTFGETIGEVNIESIEIYEDQLAIIVLRGMNSGRLSRSQAESQSLSL